MEIDQSTWNETFNAIDFLFNHHLALFGHYVGFFLSSLDCIVSCVITRTNFSFFFLHCNSIIQFVFDIFCCLYFEFIVKKEEKKNNVEIMNEKIFNTKFNTDQLACANWECSGFSCRLSTIFLVWQHFIKSNLFTFFLSFSFLSIFFSFQTAKKSTFAYSTLNKTIGTN